MVTFLATALLLALTRAEIIARMKMPVITQADGLVQVYANCPEDMRQDFQMPVASAASDLVGMLYRGAGRKPVRFRRAGIVIHLGEVRTNVADVVTRVVTNEGAVVSRIYLPAPGYADVDRFRLEVAKGFYRSVEGRELADEGAIEACRRADPAFRVRYERRRLEDWLEHGTGDVEEGFRLMRRVFEPGKANCPDVLIFASRLYFYPPYHAMPFVGRYDCLSFRDALRFRKDDLRIRLLALPKASDLPLLAGGRSAELAAAAEAYRDFLVELARDVVDEQALSGLLEKADALLAEAYGKAAARND